MQLSKSTILQLFGLAVLGIFIAMSYFNNQIFIDKIILCSVILLLVVFAKTRGEVVLPILTGQITETKIE